MAYETRPAAGKSFGDTLHAILVRTIEGDRSPGLLTLQFPTGAGKSYAVERTIATLASRMPEGSPPIIFVTPQKKNIPSVDRISDLCREEGYLPGPHDIQRLYSVSEMLARTASEELLERVPREHREKTNIEEIIDMVRLLRGSSVYEDTICRLLPQFRRSVCSLFPCKGWEERVELVESQEEWRWLAELWPATLTRRARVLLLTSSKFYLPHDTLLEASRTFDEAEWAKGSVVFMDEFDSTKQDCLNAIVSEATRVRVDLAGLARDIWNGVAASTPPESMLSGENSERNAERIVRLREVLDETARATNLDYVFKAEVGTIETNGLFMYDGTRQGTSIGATYRVRTDNAARENVIVARGKTGDRSRSLAADVGMLRGAVVYAQDVIASILLDRHGWVLSHLDDESLRNEILSVLETFGIKGGSERRFMLDGVKAALAKRRRPHGTHAEGPTIYEQGFGIVAMEESEEHRYTTHLYAYAMGDTPEARMRALIGRSLVVGLSATACIDSPLCNYDLQWLEEQAPALIRRLGDEDEGLLREAYARHTAGYGAVDLRVLPIGARNTGDATLFHAAREIVGNARLQESVANLLAGALRTDASNGSSIYPALRYARVAKAYRYFLENVPEGVFVCATHPAPRRGEEASTEYRVETIERLFDLVGRDLGISADNGCARFVEGSDSFQERYDALVGELGVACPRIFLCASYGSLATGVNLQYDGKGMRTVSVGDFAFDDRVDLVGVYLDRITNVAPTSSRLRGHMREESALACAYELREMNWRGDLSISEMDDATRGLVGNYHPRGLKLTDKPCVRAACTKTAVQMLGRMCRTTRKAPVIHVLFDEALADTTDPYAMGGALVGRETEAFLSEVAALATRGHVSRGTHENRIASRGMATAGWLASLARTGSWSIDDMRRWEDMRQWSLMNPCPTPDELANPTVARFYVGVEPEVRAYRYCARSDFSDLSVSFDLDDTEAYPLEVSERAAGLGLLARVPEVRELFERQGWPLVWDPVGVMMNPAYFQNVYLGVIGEQAGKAILESRVRGINLEPIVDPRKFEKFDFTIAGTNVYVDFKNWRAPGLASGQVQWIREKMGMVGATHALVINLLRTDELRDKKCEEIDGGILAVPYLIDDESGSVAVENVAKVISWLRNSGVLR